jgi:hypothetical protein
MDKRPNAKIVLDFPIAIAGVEVKHLTMRRPKVRDEMAFAKSKADDADKALHLMASLCEVSPDDLMELDSADFGKLESQLLDFKGAKPQ